MAKRAKSKTGGKADVETYKHKEAKRKNIPTAENQKLIADDDKAVKKLRWPRNPDLDPQLVWRGKDSESDPLEVDAPPIYIQEKIKPQAIIEDLRRQTKERSKDTAPQFDFFHDFNGLPEGWKEDATQSYYHDEGNWSNRMILGDSLLVMASLAEREGLRGKVQCIYLDPPYGIRFNSNWQPSTKSRRGRRDGKRTACPANRKSSGHFETHGMTASIHTLSILEIALSHVARSAERHRLYFRSDWRWKIVHILHGRNG